MLQEHLLYLFLQPFLKQRRFLLAYYDIIILAAIKLHHQFSTEVKADFSYTLNVGDILSIETEETVRV